MKRNPRKDLADIADALVQMNANEAEQTIELLTLHLRRAIQCPELDTLTPPTLMLDAIRSQVEGAQAKRVMGGIRRIREAIDGLESLLDRLPLARPGVVPTPCLALDIPTGGLVDRVLQGRRRSRTHGRRRAVTVPPKPARMIAGGVKPQRKVA